MILIENQYAIGDSVIIDNIEGEIFKLTIRSTVLKKKDGEKVYLQNGNIKTVTNLSQ